MLLLGTKRTTARELAKYFEVSERTIYRDLDALDRAGIPIVTAQGFGGGVELMEGYVLDRQLVDPQELSSIVGALRGLSSLFEDEEYVSARHKVESLIPARSRSDVERERSVVQFDLVPWASGKEYRDRISLLRRCARERRVVEFRYGSAEGTITVREVEPISLHFKGYTWYLWAYCRLRNGFRLFKFSRMSRIRALSTRFPDRESPGPLPDIVSQDRRSTTRFVLSFDPAARARVEEYFGEESVAEENGRIVVVVHWPLDE